MNDILIKFAAPTDSNTQLWNNGQVKGVGNTNTDLMSNITNILNVVIGLLGIICVIVIILGGITYMTSSGETAKVKKGKDTILYGIIGLIICILAFAIVNFVIANIK